MKNIMQLKSRGMLTDTQVLAAHKFSRAPTAFPMAPSLYRVPHDAVIREEPLEAMENRRGWPARSAKAIVGLLLHALQEMGATHGEAAAVSELKEQVVHLMSWPRTTRGC